MFANAGRSLVEGMFLLAGRAQELVSRAEVQGLEHLIRVLKEEGKGVVLLGAHYGNWELIPRLIVPRLPRECAVVARDLSNPWINNLVNRLRAGAGLRVLARGQTGRDYVRFLRDGNVLGILGDIDTRRGDGVFVEFFGRPAWTQRGIARIARLGNARIVLCFIARDANDPLRHTLTFEPPLSEPPDRDEEQWVLHMTQAFTRAIEQAVRRQPDQWMWMHARWRHQPDSATARGRSGRGRRLHHVGETTRSFEGSNAP